jgi:Tfp pilus assembly PilM family ATPase
MIKEIMQINKNIVFICQIAENSIKVIKCISKRGQRKEVAGLEIESVALDIDDKSLTDKLRQMLQKLGYNNGPIVLSLPRSQVTCRNLKIPSQAPQEIERIVNLQASHYLPYSTDELITSYQLIRADKDGYSNIVLVIAHKDVVNRYINILKELKPAKINIIPSSNGLANLYNYFKPDEPGPVMIVDIDSQLVEFVITSKGKLLFSRSFKLSNYTDWETLFVNEIRKTKDAYLKEVAGEPPSKIIFAGPDAIVSRCQEIINKQGDTPAEVLSFSDKVKLSKNITDKIINLDNSFASLIGLGLQDITETLNLLPRDIKEKENKNLQIKEYLRIAFFIMGIILIWVAIIAKNVDNKEK